MMGFDTVNESRDALFVINYCYSSRTFLAREVEKKEHVSSTTQYIGMPVTASPMSELAHDWYRRDEE